MALSQENINKAKQRSIDFLEVSIASTAMALGVDLAELDSSYEIPVSEDDEKYKSYKSLKDMHANLERLSS